MSQQVTAENAPEKKPQPRPHIMPTLRHIF